MKEKIAIVFGTFAPLHQGHIDLIQKAKRSYDKVRVVVSGYQGDRGQEVGLSLQKRFRYTRETFADDELTQVYKLDETSFPRYPLGWDKWLPALLELVGYDSEREELVFFVGEADYQKELEKRDFKTSLQERQFGISATMIRENPSRYWKYIAQPFRRHFTKKVLIMGSASNGKTTLAKLTPKDYYYLLLGQYAQTSRLIDSSTNRGLVVADTNSLVTKAYYDYYLKESPVQDEETDTFDNLFASILSKEKWDLILFAEPIGAYVNDGFRDMSMADEAIRSDFSSHLKRLKEQCLAHIPMVYLAGSYLDNYQAAKEAIDMIYQAD